eukprot:SAG31_NODE_7_length_42755_cov_130.245728_5_plen_89_part_00
MTDAADGGCYDNDDGSSWYLEQNNFCVYGGMQPALPLESLFPLLSEKFLRIISIPGMKSNFEGHNKRSSGNVHAYASVYVCDRPLTFV